MELSPRHMAFKFRKAESKYLVWLQSLNRYLQLEEPALWVFQQIKEDLSLQEIITECSQRYLLPTGEAERFIRDIEEQFQSLYQEYQNPEDSSIPFDTCPDPYYTPIERWIAVYDRTIRFSFGNHIIEEFIFPIFTHLEIPPDSRVYDLHMEVFIHNEYLYLINDHKGASKWRKADASKLKGALLLNVTTHIHHTTLESWMGVIHASAVSRGNRAVLFPAQPGAGKSTLAALLMACGGCKLVSDDFTTMALENQHIFSFPGAISIKHGSMPLLKSYFPQLDNAPEAHNLSKGEDVTFLAPQKPLPSTKGGYRVSAIVFVQYDGHSDFSMERVNNMEVISDFLTESWLANHGRAAEQFMEWYLKTPCYKLRYGNHQKAIESIKKLF